MKRLERTLARATPALAPPSRLRAAEAALGRCGAGLVSCAAAAWRVAADELRRLNSAGLGTEELRRRSRRERVRMVKDALAQRHGGINHCC